MQPVSRDKAARGWYTVDKGCALRFEGAAYGHTIFIGAALHREAVVRKREGSGKYGRKTADDAGPIGGNPHRAGAAGTGQPGGDDPGTELRGKSRRDQAHGGFGLDQFSAFIDRFNANAEKQQLQNRVTGLVGSMEDLPFAEGSLDLVWSEGAIDNIGFEKGLTYWSAFLKKDGYVAVTCPSWFTDERPAEVEKLWGEAGSRLDAIADNIAAMQRAGYVPAAAFVLPEVCWTEHYFRPRAAAGQALREKYPGDSTVEEFLEMNWYEEALYDRYKALYGYVFYIGKKR